ncbi:hypothetical protein B0F90DRAFT_1670504 [Multifurca ochricompacta]|uniref:Uncharacterized protein n=1 Tax=Multifurca ochricompacta TaxID=376703 RepID=A0AAD4LZZ9_9AGAM|nr:hypothetical protein B0F90DRAFT_1670504 [Multifurca ochricompacta]
MAPLEGPEKTESQEDRDWDDSDDGISDAATAILVVDKRRSSSSNSRRPLTRENDQKRQRRGRPARKKRKKDDHDDDEEKEEEEEDRPPILGYTTTSGSGSSHSSNVVPTLTPTPLSLQPLIDFLASEHAPVEAEDVSFETIAGSTLTQYARIRDALKDERHGGEGGGRGEEMEMTFGPSVQLEGGQYSSLSPFDEASLIGTLETRSQGQCGLSVSEAIILRKLKLQRHRRTQGLSQPLLRPSSPATLTALPPAPQKTASTPDHEVLRALYDIKTTPYKSSFLSRLTGFAAPHSGESTW